MGKRHPPFFKADTASGKLCHTSTLELRLCLPTAQTKPSLRSRVQIAARQNKQTKKDRPRAAKMIASASRWTVGERRRRSSARARVHTGQGGNRRDGATGPPAGGRASSSFIILYTQMCVRLSVVLPCGAAQTSMRHFVNIIIDTAQLQVLVISYLYFFW